MIINLLYVEDNLADIELFNYQFEPHAKSFNVTVVDSISDIRDQLRQSVDVVVSDFNLNGFDGIDVLTEVKNTDASIPVIFFSSSIGEERAVNLIRQGATDFILKQNLEKIPLVVERAYKEKNNLQQNQQLQSELVKQNYLLDTIFNSLGDMIYQVDRSGKILNVNKSLVLFFNTTAENLIGKEEPVLFTNRQSAEAETEVLQGKEVPPFIIDYINEENRKFVLQITKRPLLTGSEVAGVVTVIEDITVATQLEKGRLKDQNILKQAENQTFSGSFEFDLENDVLQISPNLVKMLGLKASNSVISFKKLLNHVYPEDRTLFQEKLENALEKQIDFEMEHRYSAPAFPEQFRYCKTVLKAYQGVDSVNFYGTLKDTTEARQASVSSLELQEKERSEISRELHDNVGQKLSAASMMLNIEQRDLEKIKYLVNTSIQDIRNLSRALNTPELNSETLGKNLCYLIENLPEPDKVSFISEFEDDILSDFTKGQIYRIVQESVNNALKYSKAENIQVHIKEDKNILSVQVKDNGIGFETDQMIPGNGIKNIRERVKNCSGEFNLHSMPQHGTKISIKIPINNVKNSTSR